MWREDHESAAAGRANSRDLGNGFEPAVAVEVVGSQHEASERSARMVLICLSQVLDHRVPEFLQCTIGIRAARASSGRKDEGDGEPAIHRCTWFLARFAGLEPMSLSASFAHFTWQPRSRRSTFAAVAAIAECREGISVTAKKTASLKALRYRAALLPALFALGISAAPCSAVAAQSRITPPPLAMALHFFQPTPKTYKIVSDCGSYRMTLQWRFDGRVSTIQELRVGDREIGVPQVSELNASLEQIGGDILTRVECSRGGAELSFIEANRAGSRAGARQVRYNLVRGELIEIARYNFDQPRP